MKSKQFFEMSDVELSSKLAELKSELFFLRFKHATNQLANPMALTECKKNIARVKTIIRQRELGISVKAAPASKKAK